MNKKIIYIILLLSTMLSPIKAHANIICNDGTTSRSCTTCSRGCCSRHGGCTDYSYEENNYNNNYGSSNGNKSGRSYESNNNNSGDNSQNTYHENSNNSDTNESSESQKSEDAKIPTWLKIFSAILLIDWLIPKQKNKRKRR